MKLLPTIQSGWALRLGLGLMYLYSGTDIFYHPDEWIGFLPPWFSHAVGQFVSIETYLRFQGAGEFIIGLLFLAWFSGKWGVRIASLFAVCEMAFILIFVGIDEITFRDIGLFGATITLAAISFQKTLEKGITTHIQDIAHATAGEPPHTTIDTPSAS